MAEPFDNSSPGAETRRYADYIDPVASAALEAGQAVSLDANGEAVPHDGSAPVLGIAYINADAGDRVTVKTRGTVVARVSDGVTAGDTVGTQADDAAAGDNAAGVLSDTGSEYYVLDAGAKDGVQYAEVDKF